MSVYQKLQTSSALNIVPSNNANIPLPSVVTSGITTSVVANSLIDSAALFQDKNVQVGDVVYNTSTNQAATVNAVVNQTTILLNANIFGTIGDSYKVYSNANNVASVIYVGTSGDVRVLTAGGQDVTFVGIIGGSFLPVQVLKVFQTGTGASDFVALW